MKSEWQIIEEICTKICRDTSLLPDLIQDIALTWLELDGEKKRMIVEKEVFSYWVARTVQNQWNSSTSTFYTKYRKETGREFIGDPVGEEYDSAWDDAAEMIKAWVDTLFPSDQNIIRAYFYQNLTIMQIASKYDVDKNFVWMTIHRVLRSLKRKSQWHQQTPSSEILSDLLIELVGKTRLKIEERQLVLDIHNQIHGDNFANVYDKQQCLTILNKCVRTLKM